ncbi:MAG: diguanylate cyclase [Gemmatimonadota bacterium]|nr:MAG: diguanylate cyclase [Gemmatimonadota bacterium]
MTDEQKTKKQLVAELKHMQQRVADLEVSEAKCKHAEEVLRVSHRFLGIANRRMEMIPLLREFVAEVKNFTGCTAVGIRILEDEGNIPYQVFEGFSREFYEFESPLSVNSDACMCINVIKGDTDPERPFFTEGGSFFMNTTTRFLATVSEEEKGQTRNVCNEHGYESVTLIPIRLADRILGLIHVADFREGMVPLEKVEVLETAAMELGTAIQRVRLEDILQRSKREWERTFDAMSDWVCLIDLETRRIVRSNRVGEHFTGLPLPEIIGGNCCAMAHASEEPVSDCPVEKMLRTHQRESAEIQGPDGDRWLMVTVDPQTDEQGNLVGAVHIVSDITERKRAEKTLSEQKSLLDEVFNGINEGIGIVDENETILFCNPAYADIFEGNKDDFVGKTVLSFFDAEAYSKILQGTQERRAGKTTTYEIPLVTLKGNRKFIRITASPRYKENGSYAGAFGAVLDITDRVQAEETIRQLAYHDDLTGLPNRMLFDDRLSLALAQAERHRQKFAVLLLDLDNFKDINDTLGHSVGDALLRVIGDRLTGLLRKSDTVARLGGDEFLLLLPEIGCMEDAAKTAQKILKTIREPIELDGRHLNITTSVGIALFPDHGEDGDSLIKNADIAMYRAKNRGRDTFQRYANDLKVRTIG